jgi:secreted Zn-dependent insulinase-like peptidase
MRANFKEITDESFETHKESAYKKIAQKDVQPAEEFARYVNEMTKRRYMFNKREKLGKAIKGTIKEEVKGLFERLFYTENRRIDLQLVSANLKPQHISQPTAYKSVFEVRRTLATYPACA